MVTQFQNVLEALTHKGDIVADGNKDCIQHAHVYNQPYNNPDSKENKSDPSNDQDKVNGFKTKFSLKNNNSRISSGLCSFHWGHLLSYGVNAQTTYTTPATT